VCLACKLAPTIHSSFLGTCTPLFSPSLSFSLFLSRTRRQCFSPLEPASERQQPYLLKTRTYRTRDFPRGSSFFVAKTGSFRGQCHPPPSRARRFILPRRSSLVTKALLEYITIKRFVPMRCAHTTRRATPDTHIIMAARRSLTASYITADVN